jgi:phage terminase large subunit-like protein
MVDGVSGLNALQWRGERPQFISSRRMLMWSDGSSAQLFSAEDPEELRGPQFDAAWCDELGKWRNAQETFDMLQFGLRLGVNGRGRSSQRRRGPFRWCGNCLMIRTWQ